MTRIEHLLIKLSEECNEIGKAVSKALLYGLNDGYPGSGRTNLQDIQDEFNDLLAISQMLCSENISLIPDTDKIENKKIKVVFWMEYARQRGILVANKKDGDGCEI